MVNKNQQVHVQEFENNCLLRMKCCNEGFKFLFGRLFFDSIDKELQTLLDGSKYSQKNKAEKLQVLFDRPFSHIKEYCRLTEKLACNYDAVRNTVLLFQINCINLQKTQFL